MKWFIEPLRGKYYGTTVTDGDAVITVWTGDTGKVSEREISEGWTPDYEFDHTESDKDYKIACVIRDSLNKEEL